MLIDDYVAFDSARLFDIFRLFCHDDTLIIDY